MALQDLPPGRTVSPPEQRHRVRGPGLRPLDQHGTQGRLVPGAHDQLVHRLFGQHGAGIGDHRTDHVHLTELGEIFADAVRHDLALGDGKPVLRRAGHRNLAQVAAVKRFVVLQQRPGDLELALGKVAQQAPRRLRTGGKALGAQGAVLVLGVEQHVEQDIAHHVAVLVRQARGRGHRHDIDKPPEQRVPRPADHRQFNRFIRIHGQLSRPDNRPKTGIKQLTTGAAGRNGIRPGSGPDAQP